MRAWIGKDLPENVTTSVWFLIWIVRIWEAVGEGEAAEIRTHWDTLLTLCILSYPILENC